MEWTALPRAPGPGRGGPALTALRGGTLARFGGFAGQELGGLDVYDPSAGRWESVKEEGEQPEMRSVAGFEAVESARAGGERVVAVLFLGEREGAPAELGHDGAGAVSLFSRTSEKGLMRPLAVPRGRMGAPGGPQLGQARGRRRRGEARGEGMVRCCAVGEQGRCPWGTERAE